MTVWLDWMEHRMPKFISRIELQLLMNLTARVFEQKTRIIWIYKPTRALEIYAGYTKELLLSRSVENDAHLRERMGAEAFKMGGRLRKLTGLTDYNKLERLVFYLYKNIGIDMQGNIPGNIYVSKCYFSNFYNPQMCQVISDMDNGIISGLYGGGELLFKERITEGCAGCKTCFRMDKDVRK